MFKTALYNGGNTQNSNINNYTEYNYNNIYNGIQQYTNQQKKYHISLTGYYGTQYTIDSISGTLNFLSANFCSGNTTTYIDDIYNPINRIDYYLSVLNSNINNRNVISTYFRALSNDYDTQGKNATINISCAARNTKIEFTQNEVQLTGYANAQKTSKDFHGNLKFLHDFDIKVFYWTQLRYHFMSQFYKDSVTEHVIKTQDFQFSKPIRLNQNILFTMFPTLNKYRQNFNCFDTLTYINKDFFNTYTCNDSKNRIIKLNLILVLLNFFINELNKIYKFQVFLNVYTTDVTTLSQFKIKNVQYTGNDYFFDEDDYTTEDAMDDIGGQSGLALQRTVGYYAPYSITRTPSIVKFSTASQLDKFIIRPQQSITYIKIQDLLCLKTNIIPGIKCEFFNDTDYSNGIFLYNTKCVCNKNNNNIITLSEIQKMFNLYTGQVINIKNVINAIDYIFNLWILNIQQTLSFYFDICHTNCHTNMSLILDLESYNQCCLCNNCNKDEDSVSWLFKQINNITISE